MAETRIYNGFQYVRNAPGEPWRKAGPAQAALPANPIKVQQAEVQIDNTQAGTGKTVADTRRTEALLPYDIRKADAEAQAAERKLNAPDLTPAIREKSIADFQSALDLSPILDELDKTYRAGPGATSGLAGWRDWLPLPENQAFDSTANKLRGFVKRAQGFTGGEGNTATEMQMNVGAFIPSSADYDVTTEKNLKALRGEQQRGLRTAISTIGGIPDQNGRITPVPAGYQVGQFPELDVAVSRQISRVPPANRQRFLVDALRRYQQKMKAPPRGGSATIRFDSQGNRIND